MFSYYYLTETVLKRSPQINYFQLYTPFTTNATKKAYLYFIENYSDGLCSLVSPTHTFAAKTSDETFTGVYYSHSSSSLVRRALIRKLQEQLGCGIEHFPHNIHYRPSYIHIANLSNLPCVARELFIR